MTILSRILVVGMFVSSLLVGSAAHAIVGGDPDVEIPYRYPNVGSIVVMVDGFPFQWCSGTLIAPTVFLTAGHCVRSLWELDQPVWGVTFDPDVTYMTTWFTGTAYAPMDLARHGWLMYPDVAVIVLDPPLPGIEPAELPTENLLNVMKARNELRGALFEVVGYGVGGTIKPKFEDWSVQYRQVAVLNFQSLQPRQVLLTNNKIKDLAGICWGDSGGPGFFQNTSVIAGIVQHANHSSCTNLDGLFRIDTPEVRSFLAYFVDLP